MVIGISFDYLAGKASSVAGISGPNTKNRSRLRLAIGVCPMHNCSMYKLLHYERADYSVVVKNRAPPPKAWRWEIYRAGNANPIKQSSICFDTTMSAKRAGKVALTELLNKLFS